MVPAHLVPADTAWRAAMRKAEALGDDHSKAALAALRDAVKDDPDPQHAALNLCYAATQAAQACGIDWAFAMQDLLRRFRDRETGGDGLAPEESSAQA